VTANFERRLVCLLLGCLAACGRAPTAPAGRAPAARTPGVRVTMAALHASGGVPVGWALTPPSGSVEIGRRTFEDLGCPACHRIADETFSTPSAGIGPELTGMGSHHPAAYFVESIINPDAVLVEGDGYVDAGGHSTMPDYPDLTVTQLADVVAYLSSLRGAHPMPATEPAVAQITERPSPPAREAKAFMVQSYQVRPGMLEAFERWMRDTGMPRLREHGVVAIETFVDFTRARNPYTTVYAFRDGAALQAAVLDPAVLSVDREFDGFVSDHEHLQKTWSPMYRAPSLSDPN
jgi:mono/diheme cytochrome c family protein